MAGLWVYLVPAQRATDLGIYSARMAIQTAWEVGVKENKWRSRRCVSLAPRPEQLMSKRKMKLIPVMTRRNGEILYFAAAMGVLMSAYEVSVALAFHKSFCG